MRAAISTLRTVALASLLCSCQLVLGIEEAKEIEVVENLGGTKSSSGGTEPKDEPTEDSDDDSNEPTSSGGKAPVDESMGGSPAEAPPTVCEEYCEHMGSFCKKDSEQFAGDEQCLKTCELYDEGAVGQDGPTQACRAKYAAKGRYTGGVERDLLCRQAGPAGYGVCGTMCEGYCDVVMEACTADVTSIYYYETYEECLGECEMIPAPDDVLYGATNPEVFDGAHLQCRLFHALSALMLDAEEHCEHALGVTLCELSVAE